MPGVDIAGVGKPRTKIIAVMGGMDSWYVDFCCCLTVLMMYQFRTIIAEKAEVPTALVVGVS